MMKTDVTLRVDLTDALERIPVQIFSTLAKGSRQAAQQVADFTRAKQKASQKCVLGLATDSAPKTFYIELVRLHKVEGLSFKNVLTSI